MTRLINVVLSLKGGCHSQSKCGKIEIRASTYTDIDIEKGR